MVDIIIIGGGIEGCYAALRASQLGLKTVLIEKRTFLGREITAHYKTFIKEEGLAEFVQEEELISPILFDKDQKDGDFYEERKHRWRYEGLAESYYDEIPLQLGKSKKQFLNKMLESKVQVLLMSEPAALAVKGNKVQGVVIANKYGMQLLKGRAVFDFTERRNSIRLLQGSDYLEKGPQKVTYIIELENVNLPESRSVNVPEKLGIFQNKVKLHPTKKEYGNALLEFSYIHQVKEEKYYAKSVIDHEARIKALELVISLKEHEDDCFSYASIANLAYEAFIEATESSYESSYDNLYTNDKPLPYDFSFKDLINLKSEIEDKVDQAAKKLVQYPYETPEMLISKNFRIPVDALSLTQFEDIRLGVELYKIDIKDFKNKLEASDYDVVIAGTGTGGVMAAFSASESSSRTLAVEAFTDFGGTRTVGHVTGYYHGYRGGITGVTDEKITEMDKSLLNRDREKGASGRISRILYYHKEFDRRKIKFLLGTTICDVRLEGNQVKGLIAVNEEGMFLINSKITVDTTGDADVAYFAGAEYNIGDPIDGNMQSYSQWGLENKKISNFKEAEYLMDFDVIDNSKYSELLRGLYIAHGKNSDYYFCNMLTVRESRRIKGEYQLNMQDIFRNKFFEDCLSVAYCPVDNHGRTTSLYGRLGFMSGHGDLMAQIPYRCFIPKGLEGLLVGAKALSATRDAASICRMNADIQNAGYALGLAASAIAESNIKVRELNVNRLLRRKLIEREILPSWAQEKAVSEEDQLQKYAEDLKAGTKFGLFHVIKQEKDSILPLLYKEFEKASKKEKTEIAKAFAWFGEEKGAELLIEELKNLYDNERLHGDEGISEGSKSIEANISDKAREYWKVNQLLVLLALTRNKKDMETIFRIVNSSEAGGKPVVSPMPYYASRVDSIKIPFYERNINIAFALSRIPDKKAIKPLELLLQKEYIGGYFTPKESVAEAKSFFGAYLELALAKALARCGGRKGYELLIRYLDDCHYILMKDSYVTLKELTGEDFRLDSAAWNNWLEKSEDLKVVPYVGNSYTY